MLKVKNLYAGYGKMEVLHGISLKVEKGQIVAVLGPNGSGKSTLMYTIAGIIEPREGEITFNNMEMNKIPAHLRAKYGIVLIPEGRRLFPNLTVLENLKIIPSVFKIPEEEFHKRLEYIFQLFPILKERLHQKARTLSGGEQQMLAIARALLLKPQLLMFDEPTLGLMPKLTPMIFRLVKELNEDGMTILISEQNVMQTMKIADYVYILEQGKIIYEGTSREIMSNEIVSKTYLGI